MRRRTFVHGWGAIAGLLCAMVAGLTKVCADESPSVSPQPAGSAVVEATPGITLDELIALAESSSPNLRQAAADVEAARGKAYQAGLYPNPTLSGGGNQIVGNQSQYFGAMSQEIVTKHKLRLDRAAACREVYQAEQMFVKARFELLTTVRQSFVTTLAAQRRTEVLTRLVEIVGKSQQAAQRLQQAGEGTRSDSLLFEIELEKAELGLENNEARWQASRRQLVANMGLRNLTIERLVGNLTESMDGVAQQVLLDGYVPYNAAVQSAEHGVERNRFLLQRALVQPFPNITVYSGYQYQIEPRLHNMAILQASVPLPLWNRNEGNIAAAQAEVNRAEATVEQIQNEIARQMADAAGRYRIADQQAKRYADRIVPRAREGVKIMQEGFAQGQFDFLRLLQTQRALVEANLGYIDALETRWSAAAQLAGLAQIEAFP